MLHGALPLLTLKDSVAAAKSNVAPEVLRAISRAFFGPAQLLHPG